MQTRWLRYESMEINHEDAINPNNIQLFPRCGISRLHLNDLRYFTEDLLLHNVVNTLVPVLHGNLGVARSGWTSTCDTWFSEALHRDQGTSLLKVIHQVRVHAALFHMKQNRYPRPTLFSNIYGVTTGQWDNHLAARV